MPSWEKGLLSSSVCAVADSGPTARKAKNLHSARPTLSGVKLFGGRHSLTVSQVCSEVVTVTTWYIGSTMGETHVLAENGSVEKAAKD